HVRENYLHVRPAEKDGVRNRQAQEQCPQDDDESCIPHCLGPDLGAEAVPNVQVFIRRRPSRILLGCQSRASRTEAHLVVRSDIASATSSSSVALIGLSMITSPWRNATTRSA